MYLTFSHFCTHKRRGQRALVTRISAQHESFACFSLNSCLTGSHTLIMPLHLFLFANKKKKKKEKNTRLAYFSQQLLNQYFFQSFTRIIISLISPAEHQNATSFLFPLVLLPSLLRLRHSPQISISLSLSLSLSLSRILCAYREYVYIYKPLISSEFWFLEREKSSSQPTMMGSESATEHHPFGSPPPPPPPPREEMESLIFSDDHYQSAMATSVSSSSAFHPLSAVGNPSKNPSSPSSSAAVAFLDPPSYADAIFTPFNSENGDPSRASSSSALHRNGTSSKGSIFGKITVSSPQKEQEASSSLVASTYVTYLITTRTSESECSVRRRFRDFVTLADRLAEAYRGFFVPVRPDKSVVESQVMHKQEFVEQRRSALEKYLRRLAGHPVIGKSEELRVFLQVHAKLPLPTTTDVASRMLDGAVRLPKQLFGEVGAGYVAPQEVVQPAKGGRDLLRIFKELKQSVTNDWSGMKPMVVEEDRDFLEKKEKMKDLEQQLSTTSQQAEALVKAQQDIGETMGELGLAFIKLTKFETEEAIYNSQQIRAADIQCVATAAVKASRFFQESNAQTVKHLDTLHEYLGIMLAVHSAFSDHSSALLTVQTLLSDLCTLQVKAEKLEAASSKIFGGDRSRIRKVEELKETIRVTEDAKGVAVREYEKIKENNRNELDRLDKEMHDDFLAMLKGFVVNQVGYAEKIASVWEKVVEETSAYAKECDL